LKLHGVTAQIRKQQELAVMKQFALTVLLGAVGALTGKWQCGAAEAELVDLRRRPSGSSLDEESARGLEDGAADCCYGETVAVRSVSERGLYGKFGIRQTSVPFLQGFSCSGFHRS
jgi:hypothetical protein